MLEVFDDLIYISYKLAYLGFPRLKQVPAGVPLLVLKFLWKEEMICQNLHKEFVVNHGFFPFYQAICSKNWRSSPARILFVVA